MAGKLAAVTGARNSHSGTITGTGAKLTVQGKVVAVTGSPCACITPQTHASTVVATSKLSVSGKMVGHIGTPCACGATITSTPQTKLTI